MQNTEGLKEIKEPIKGFKGFSKQTDGSIKCRNLTYKSGQQIHMPIDPKLCSKGLHFCRTLEQVFEHYSPDNKNNVYYHVIGEGKGDFSENKIAVDTLTVLEAVSPNELEKAITSFYIDDLLKQVRTIQLENSNVVISGSLALIMMKLIKPRQVHDLDLTLNAFSDFNGKAEVIAGGGESGNDCIKMNFDSLPIFDLFINPNLIYKTCNYNGHTYKISDPRPILEAKWKYFMKGKEKHAADLIQILLPFKEVFNEDFEGIVIKENSYESGNIMKIGFDNLDKIENITAYKVFSSNVPTIDDLFPF